MLNKASVKNLREGANMSTLKVLGGRFPEKMACNTPMRVVSWDNTDVQVRSVHKGVYFSVKLLKHGDFALVYKRPKSEIVYGFQGFYTKDDDSGIIRLDSLEALDFWMELKLE